MAALPVQSGSGGFVDLEFLGNVAVLTMNRGENRFNIDYFQQMLSALDKVIGNPDVKCLVTTGAGKFYSNGVDLPWFTAALKANDSTLDEFYRLFHDVHKRIMTFPLPTIAMINGHVFAGGAVLALSHDYRIMNSTRGWFCLNEVRIGAAFATEWLRRILHVTLPDKQVFREAAVLGTRYTAEEAKAANIIQVVTSAENLRKTTFDFAAKFLAQGDIQRNFLEANKAALYENVFEKGHKRDAPFNSNL